MKTQFDAARRAGTAPELAEAPASPATAGVVRQLLTLFSGPATRRGRRSTRGAPQAALGRAG